MDSPPRTDIDILTQLLRPLHGATAAQHAVRLITRHRSLPQLLAIRYDRPPSDKTMAYLDAVATAMRAAASARMRDRLAIDTSAAAAEYLMGEMAHLPIEHIRVLFLNARNGLIADETVMRGTIDHAPFYPREIFRRALDLHAASILVAHNHPSGYPQPSAQDIAVTRQLCSAGNALGIAILDHLILASAGWISLRATGAL